jgi:putative methylase
VVTNVIKKNHSYEDIVGKTVIDLGAGTGRLAIGAATLGAHQVMAIDIDPVAIEVARENAETAMADIDWIVGDLEGIRGEFDTVMMNPPFGTKQRHLDKVFSLINYLEINLYE